MPSGGGHVLDNLWRWGEGIATEHMRFDLLDDGGLSVYYDGYPATKWTNIMWRGTLANAGMRVGETYYLAEFGTTSVINTNMRFLDAGAVIIPNQPTAFERAVTAPEGAVYVEMYVSLSGEEKPQRFTSYPMLVRGSARPAGFVPPNKAGGGNIVNLVGRAPVTVFTNMSTDFVEVMPDVVRYKVADDWGASFVMFDVEPGAYKSDRPVLICTQQIGYANRNEYYSEKLGVDTYAGPVPSSMPFSITENAKLGFSLPQGEGEIHPRIIRVL